MKPKKLTIYILVIILCTCTNASIIQSVLAQDSSDAESERIGKTLNRAAPSVRWNADGRLVYSVSGGDTVSHRVIDPQTGAEEPFDAPVSTGVEQPRPVRPGLFAHRPPVMEVPSPDRRLFAGTWDGDIWLRSAGSDDRVRLTSDGRPGFGFDIQGAKWSPDGQRLAVKKVDTRDLQTIPFVRWSAPGEPVVQHPYSYVGDPIPRATLFIVDREGEPTRIDLGEGDMPYLHIIGWSRSGDEIYFMRISRFTDRVDLLAANSRTGGSRTILSETSDTFIVGLPFLPGNDMVVEWLNHIVLLEDGRRFIWTSERDGWRRLYLYDLDGDLIRPLTPTGSEIGRLEAVDEERDWVYYTARIDSDRPYDLTLMRAPLDGGDPEPLVTGPNFTVPGSFGGPFTSALKLDPKHDFFWTRREDIDQPPVVELRRADGTLVRELWSGETIAHKSGWTPPEQITAKAADGETDLYGVLFKPHNFDPDRKYPVVEYLYLGAHTNYVPRTIRGGDHYQALADLGFIVLLVDARGTPGRGKVFHDAFFGQIGQHEIADHAAVLRQQASGRPYMDLDRVGAFGHSWGGYGVLRALLLEPELYKVGVASSPAVDLDHFRMSIEPYMGCLPEDCPEAYELGSSTRLADRLQGKLLLLHGTSDDDVPFGETARFISSLIEAGKPYDLVIFPEAHHGINFVPPYEAYWWQRATDYLREHLQP